MVQWFIAFGLANLKVTDKKIHFKDFIYQIPHFTYISPEVNLFAT